MHEPRVASMSHRQNWPLSFQPSTEPTSTGAMAAPSVFGRAARSQGVSAGMAWKVGEASCLATGGSGSRHQSLSRETGKELVGKLPCWRMCCKEKCLAYYPSHGVQPARF